MPCASVGQTGLASALRLGPPDTLPPRRRGVVGEGHERACPVPCPSPATLQRKNRSSGRPAKRQGLGAGVGVDWTRSLTAPCSLTEEGKERAQMRAEKRRREGGPAIRTRGTAQRALPFQWLVPGGHSCLGDGRVTRPSASLSLALSSNMQSPPWSPPSPPSPSPHVACRSVILGASAHPLSHTLSLPRPHPRAHTRPHTPAHLDNSSSTRLRARALLLACSLDTRLGAVLGKHAARKKVSDQEAKGTLPPTLAAYIRANRALQTSLPPSTPHPPCSACQHCSPSLLGYPGCCGTLFFYFFVFFPPFVSIALPRYPAPPYLVSPPSPQIAAFPSLPSVLGFRIHPVAPACLAATLHRGLRLVALVVPFPRAARGKAAAGARAERAKASTALSPGEQSQVGISKPRVSIPSLRCSTGCG